MGVGFYAGVPDSQLKAFCDYIEDIYGIYIDVLYVDTIEKKAYDAYDFVGQVMATDLVYIQENIFPKLEGLEEIEIEIQD